MSGNVRVLPGVKLQAEVNAEVIEDLEKWLADAKAGRLVSVAMAGVTSEGHAASAFCVAAEHENNLAAAIMQLSFRYGHKIMPESER